MQIGHSAKGQEGAASSFPPGIKYLNTIAETADAISRSRSSVYLMIAAGELDAVKDGARTLVYGDSILRRTANLPRAEFGRAKEAA